VAYYSAFMLMQVPRSHCPCCPTDHSPPGDVRRTSPIKHSLYEFHGWYHGTDLFRGQANGESVIKLL
jgi:hypothetical protein